MDYDKLFPGRFLKSGEFGGKDVTLTVAGIRLEELPQDKGGNRTRGVVGFRETKRELVLNRTNGECFKALFGRETDSWIGKRVTLYPAPFRDPFTGQDGTAIRVKGSPDIDAPRQVEVRLPKRSPIQMTMQKTGTKAPNGKAAKAPKARDEQFDPRTGELPPPTDAEFADQPESNGFTGEP